MVKFYCSSVSTHTIIYLTEDLTKNAIKFRKIFEKLFFDENSFKSQMLKISYFINDKHSYDKHSQGVRKGDVDRYFMTVTCNTFSLQDFSN